MKKAIFGAIIAALYLLDQITKRLASTLIDPLEAIEVLPVFNLVNVENVGAAFGMFGGLGNTFFIVVSIVAIWFVLYMLVKEKENTLALSLILSGALGNLTDRLLYGYVRDFLDFHIAGHHWPAFNVADSALTVGIGLFILGTVKKEFMRKSGQG